MQRRAILLQWTAAVLMTAFAVALGVFLARPIHAASIAFDSQVAVLDFNRLVNGRRVEVFLSTTPKPLLTFIFGPLEMLTRDWRSVAWATLLAFGVGVALVAELVRRSAGWFAWLFVGVGLAGSAALLFDVAYALAVPWAMLCWAVAGLALSRPTPRYAVAGLALLLATLARLESILIVGLVALILVAFAIPPVARAAARARLGRPPRRAWLLLLGLGALPIMAIHDQLIYGDPLFWSTVAGRYSAVTTQHILSPLQLAEWIARHELRLLPLVILGLIGFAHLVRIRAWVLVVGVLAMGPGLIVFLEYLAARHIFVPDRYVAPADIAGIVAAGIGAAWVAQAAIDRLVRDRADAPRARSLVTGVAVVGVALAAVISTWPTGILDRDLRASAHRSLALAANLDQMLPTLRRIVEETPGAQTWPKAGQSTTADERSIFVPQPYLPRMSVDLDAPLGVIAGSSVAAGPGGGHLQPGQHVAHDRHGDGESSVWQPFESDSPVTVDGVLVVPVKSDPARGWWISSIQAGN
jgi:hypothetical protein